MACNIKRVKSFNLCIFFNIEFPFIDNDLLLELYINFEKKMLQIFQF